MPLVDKPLNELLEYKGANPKPQDFDSYWSRALEELDATDPSPELEPVDEIHPAGVEMFHLTFTGLGGARIYAKYLRPKAVAGVRHPAILNFHGYSGKSGAWSHLLRLVAGGASVAGMDVRGQAGRSEDLGSVRGNTLNGHVIRGLGDAPEKLLFRSIFMDTVQLARVIRSFEETDPDRMSSFGGSQGGALSLACAALDPSIGRCVSEFPFLSDFKRVWEMDLLKDAYAEIKTFLRSFDPNHTRLDEIFTQLGYIDVHHLAPRIRAETIMAITLMDTICPPSTQFAAFNNLQCPKTKILYPDFGHEDLPGFEDQIYDFVTWLK